MFEVGDRVVHPVHGLGTITEISDHCPSGEEERCYVIQMEASDSKVLAPVDRTDEMGLRQAPGKSEAKEILSVVSAPGEPLPQDKKERRQLLTSVVRSMDVLRQAEIFRDLSWRDQRKGLSSREYWLYRRLERLLSGELALARGMDPGDAQELLEETVKRSL